MLECRKRKNLRVIKPEMVVVVVEDGRRWGVGDSCLFIHSNKKRKFISKGFSTARKVLNFQEKGQRERKRRSCKKTFINELFS